jgi:hypothetical protein
MFDQFIDKAFKPIVVFASLVFLAQTLIFALNQLVYLFVGASKVNFIAYVLLSAAQLWIVSIFLFALAWWFFSRRKKS